MSIGNLRIGRAYAKWEEWEDKLLLHFVNKNVPFKAIVKFLQRQTGGVDSRIIKLVGPRL